MTDFNLPVPDDAPWLNLSQEKVEQLRQQKKELTKYAKEKLKKLATKALEELSESERKEFYRFFVVEYYMTGEGISYWFKICRNHPSYDGEDNDLESFKKFIDNSYHSQYIKQLTEKEFMSKYANLIPAQIVRMIEHKVQPEFIWETHFHVNYS